MSDNKIEFIYAWICIKESDNEALGAFIEDGFTVPLIDRDLENVAEFRETLHDAAKTNGVNFKLVKFGIVEVLETIEFGN